MAPIIKQILATPAFPRPEADQLRTENIQLRRDQCRLRQEHAREIADMRNTIACYANQIQALTLRNAHLESDNAALRAQLNGGTGNVIALPLPR